MSPSYRPCGVVVEMDGELRFVEGEELSALRGSDALLMEGQFVEGFDERPVLEAAREQMSERIEELLVEWHGDEIRRRAEAMIAAGRTPTVEDLLAITREVARSHGKSRSGPGGATPGAASHPRGRGDARERRAR